MISIVGCGDNLVPSTSDPDAAPPQVCRLDLAVADLAGGTWDPRFTIAGFTGLEGIAPTVLDFAYDRDGSILAAGSFDHLGATRVPPLLRFRDGAWQPARATWELPLPVSGFAAVAVAADGTLALATYDDFSPLEGEIWLDDGSGLRVIGAFAGNIRTLAWFDGQLWAGGFMELALDGGAVSRGLAVWDGTRWSAPPGGTPDAFVYELVVDAGELLVGGSFTRIGGIAATGVAAYDTATWRALNVPIRDSTVYALARGPDGALYAGGSFGDFDDGDGAGGILRWTGTRWVESGGGVALAFAPGVVSDLVVHDGSLYVSGCFTTVGGAAGSPGATTSVEIARWDGAWHAVSDSGPVGAWYEPRECGDTGPDKIWSSSKQRLFDAGDRVLLGGTLPGMARVLSQAVIAYDGASWIAQGPSDGLGIGGSVDRLGVASDTCELWGFGLLSHVGGEPVQGRVVRFDGNRWTSIRDDIPRTIYCPGFSVSKQGDVALSCFFDDDVAPYSRIYRVSGDQLVQVGGDVPVISVLAHDTAGRLWVGGGGPGGFLARLDGDQLVMVEQGFDAPLTLLEVGDGTDLIVAGYFTKVGAVDALHLVRGDGTAWRALGNPPGTVTAIARDGEQLYLSTADDGTGFLLLASFDGTTWNELGSAAAGITPHRFFQLNAIRPIDGGLVVAGTALSDDGSGRTVFVFANGTFRPVDGGVNAILATDLAITHDEIWVGGQVTSAGAGERELSSVGVARFGITR